MDAGTRAWLEQELVSALGFPEVGDIAGYIASTFKSKGEVAAYLVELLGIPSSRAASIGARLFPAAAPPTSSTKKQQQSKPSKAAASPLVTRPVEVNSRLKPAKNLHGGASKAGGGGVRSSHVINCLRCGRIEHNGGRKCAFCDSPLRYEALPDGYDAGSSAVVPTGGGFPASAKARGAFEEAGGDKSGDDAGDASAAGRARSTARVWRNPDLPKDAQELVERAARQLAKDSRKQSRPRPGDGGGGGGGGPTLASRGRVLRDGDTYSLVIA